MGVHMTPDNHNQIWDLVEAGKSYASIGKVIGRRLTTVRDLPTTPSPPQEPRPRQTLIRNPVMIETVTSP